MYKKGDTTQFPTVITLFSAPNYASHYNNKAAIMCYEGTALTIKQYRFKLLLLSLLLLLIFLSDSPAPFVLPDFQNAFEWSLPFLAEKLSEIVETFYAIIQNDELLDLEEVQREEMRNKLKLKVLAVILIIILK